ncbi:MAG: 16S rRNA (guanine(966)-N(2))-methyltransferase RsmD [Gemmatimonadota bacterium]
MRIIAGRWGGRRLKAPKGKAVRPTTDRVREAWMSAAGPELPEARVLDLFAGSGALGLEALSRGAAEVVFVERARDALTALRENVATLGAEEGVTVVSDDVFRFLDRVPTPFDVAFADPPYETGDARALVERFLARPFARMLWLEHPWREKLPLPDHARTRRYGDTALTTLIDHDATGTDDRST